jgi:hypothetical protein
LLRCALSAKLAFANTDAAHTSTIDSRNGCSVGDEASALKSPVMTCGQKAEGQGRA